MTVAMQRVLAALRSAPPSSPRLLLLTAALALGASGWQLPRAQAQAEAEAEAEANDYRRWIESAVAEYGAGNFEEAHALFSKAHAATPTARTHRGLGMTAFELRNYVESIEHLEAALRAPKKPLHGELRSTTEQLLQRANEYVGSVTIVTRPSDARVEIDKAPRPSGRAVRLRVGEHELEVAAEGYELDRRTLWIGGGKPQRVEVALNPLIALLEASDTMPAADVGAQRRAWYKSPWLWSGVAIVAAGAATTAVLLTRPEQREADYGGSANVRLTAQ